ncbi:MAG: hypothetical protein QXT14_08665 [Candidatus Bathyarchaeia archaeon]
MSRLGAQTSFLGFLVRVTLSIPLWFLLTLLIAYLLLKTLDIEPPVIEALTSLNLSKLYENDFTIAFPATILSGFIALVVVWAVLWRGGAR